MAGGLDCEARLMYSRLQRQVRHAFTRLVGDKFCPNCQRWRKIETFAHPKAKRCRDCDAYRK